MAGRINTPGVQIEALDSRSGFASLTDNEGNFVLLGVMWYPEATYTLVVHEDDTTGKLVEVTGPRQLPESGQFDVGEVDFTRGLTVDLQSLIGLNSISIQDFDTRNRDYYKDLFVRLTEGKQSDEEKIAAINDYVATRFNLDERQRELESPRRVLERGSRYCAFLGIAMQSLLSVGGYQTRQVHMVDGREPPASHAVVEVFYNGGWHLYDPSYGFIFRKPGGEVASYSDIRLNTDLIDKTMFAKFEEKIRLELMALPTVYGTGYHHFFYFRGEEWNASKARPSF